MKTPYYSIYKVLRLNRFIVLSVVIIAFASSTFSLVEMRRAHREMLSKAFAVQNDGTVLPLKLRSQKENLKVEVLAHLDQFHRYFYDLNTSNYEAHLEKALWLGNSSVDEVYRQKKADGIYNRILQYALVQKVNQITSRVDLSREPYTFSTRVRFKVNRGEITDHYILQTSGELIRVERNFPKNPHGLLITHFFENSLKQINDEPR